MGLPYIDKNALIAEAGGDPWAINASLQAGSPLQISNLAKAFHRAGRCTAESDNAFQQALTRFEAAWNHQDGGHPINDSAEVQRVVQSLGAQSLQLPKIGTDLENIAAALADAQKAGGARITTLDAQLKNISDSVVHAVALLNDTSLSGADKDAIHAFINTCEDDALRDTKAALAALQSIRNGYSDGLQKSLTNLHAEGYDGAPLHGADADGVAPPSPDQQAALADIRQAIKQAVADQLAKVRAARDALNKAAADLYIHGPGSPEGDAANARLPKLKADLKEALDGLRKIPDYDGIDPASINVTPDGHFMFTYDVNGQSVQAFGQLKNGTGEFFDQATGTYYTFNGGKLTGMRTPDPGQVQATPEPLWTAITLAVGGPGLKAGGEALLQGAKMLFGREAFEGLTSESLAAQSLSGTQLREAFDLPPRSTPGIGGEPVPGTHPLEPPSVEHAPPADAPVEHAPAAPHVAVSDAPPPVVDPAHPEFHLDDPLKYMPPDLRALSEQHLTGSGETVLGPYKNPLGGPSYIDFAQQRGASYFDIGDAWNSATPVERLAANQHVLDIAIANRDTIKLSTSIDRILDNTYTAAELNYLKAHGYQVIDGYTLVPPKIGG
ncbi:MAG: hypothetical protein VX424_01045 [Actinomycetota bacterium]|nr:hypothetical protein [Actinomycetota bacterium]